MQQLRSSRSASFFARGGFLGGFLRLPGLLGRLMVILDPPELVISLKNTMVNSYNGSDEGYIQKGIIN